MNPDACQCQKALEICCVLSRLNTVPPNVLLSNVQEALRELELEDIPDEDEDADANTFKSDQKTIVGGPQCKCSQKVSRPLRSALNANTPADDLSAFHGEATRQSRPPCMPLLNPETSSTGYLNQN